MAASKETLRLVDGLRIVIGERVDAAGRDIVHAWARAWNEIAAEWDAAIADLVARSNDGRWPSRWQVARAERAQAALALTRDRLDSLARDLPVRVMQDVPHLASIAGEWQARLIASQLPVHAVDQAVLASTFNRIDQTALDAIVQRSREQITALSAALAAQADAALRAVLVRGIAVGENPRRAAQRMLGRVQGAFDGGRNRALVIARTEMLDAHRTASSQAWRANADVVAGWQWVAALDKRTCPSCLAQHGTIHDLSEDGPQDHQQGRCTAVPVTKPWSELGFAIPEPASILPDSRAWFDAQPEADQVAIMGRDRLQLLRSGKVSWDDLSQRRRTPGWRDSFAPRSVQDLRKRAAAVA